MRAPISLASALTAATALAMSSCAAARPPDASPEASGPPAGEAHVSLLGNYVGKQIRLWIDGDLLEDRRFTFPPMGAVDRVTVRSGTARAASVRIEIEGCDPWTGQIALEPLGTSSLVFDGCAVTAFGPN